MVKCLLCGRDFKNEAGLSGHVRLAHPSASTVDGGQIEARLLAIEHELNFVHALVGTMNETQRETISTISTMVSTINTIMSKLKQRG